MEARRPILAQEGPKISGLMASKGLGRLLM